MKVWQAALSKGCHVDSVATRAEILRSVLRRLTTGAQVANLPHGILFLLPPRRKF